VGEPQPSELGNGQPTGPAQQPAGITTLHPLAAATAEPPVGLVVGTVPATPLQFSVGLAPGQYLQLDDVVVTRRELPGQPSVQIAGVVTNVEAVHEGARFASDVFLIAGGALLAGTGAGAAGCAAKNAQMASDAEYWPGASGPGAPYCPGQ